MSDNRIIVHYRQIGGTKLPLKRPAWSFFISEEIVCNAEVTAIARSESVFHYQLTRYTFDLKSEVLATGRGLRSLSQARRLLAQSARLVRRSPPPAPRDPDAITGQ